MKLEYVKASVTILSPGWNNARSEMVSAFCVPAVKIIWSQEASTWKVDSHFWAVRLWCIFPKVKLNSNNRSECSPCKIVRAASATIELN